MTENREKAIKRTKNLAYWFMGEMLKEEERGEKEKEAFEKAKGEASFGTEIHTIPGNGKGRYLPGTGEILFQNHPIL